MSIATSYPGVYVQEISSGVRTITGVSTSVAAFVGFFPKGAMDKAVQVFNMSDFTREFGGLHAQSEASYAIQQFFANGGAEAWVVRTATDAKSASVEILAGINGSSALVVTAINPGDWGNRLRVRIDPISPALANAGSNPFNMTVLLVEERDGREVTVQSEEFLGLTVNASDARFVGTVVNDRFSGSKLVRVSVEENPGNPLQNGTLSGELPSELVITNDPPQLTVTIGSEGSGTAKLESTPKNLGQARTLLEKAIQAARQEIRAFSGASVTVVGNRLRILAGPTESDAKVTFSAAEGTDMTTINTLGLPGTTLQGRLSGELDASFNPSEGKLKVSIGNSDPQTLELVDTNNLEELRGELEDKIRGIDGEGEPFTKARVALHTIGGETRLVVIAGTENDQVNFTPEENDSTATNLKLEDRLSTAIAAVISDNLQTPLTINANAEVNLAIGSERPHPVTFPASPPNTLKELAVAFENAIHEAHDSSPAFTGACVAAYTNTNTSGENRLIIWAGNITDAVVFSPAPNDTTTAKELRLDSSDAQAKVQSNVQYYALGPTRNLKLTTAQGSGTPGDNGALPDGTTLLGQRLDKSGIYALEDVDLFNLLCIPRASMVGEDLLSVNEAFAVQRAAIDYCEERRAFFLMDTPTGRDEVQEIKDWLEENAGLRHKNAALYFPRIEIPDPLNGFRLRSIGACGTIAGLYARTDSARGVWKAPAGTEATLRNAKQLEYCLTDRQNGTLNPLAINCLRNFPVYGPVCWGARTLDGSDQQASEWKYVPIRRLALFIEESLFRGTQWVVFEPNDEPLWAQIRLNIGAFMHDLFRKGAFQGTTPREAYFVKCDKETTPQSDINKGIVNIIVGFAPLKPAEFVIISIQQIAGQIEV